MSLFSRRARWLNVLFPASVAPAKQAPGDLSNDVSLVQQYDGGGWIIPDRSTWFRGPFLSPTAIAGETPLLTVSRDEVFRLFSVHVFTVVGQTAHVSLVVSPEPAQGGVVLTPEYTTAAIGIGGQALELNRPIVVPPGAHLYGAHFLGNTLTIISWSLYGCLAPAGSVFNC